MSLLKPLERSGKKLFSFLLKIFIPSEEVRADEIQLNEIQKILIVHQDRKIGNFILTTPLLESAKYNFPNAELDLLVSKNNSILAEDFSGINQTIIFDHKTYLKKPDKFLKLISLLRRNNYSLAVESSKPGGTSFLNGLITYLSKAKYRVGFEGGNGSIFTNIHIKPDFTKHYYSIKQELINIFSKEQKLFKPKIFSDNVEVKKMRELLQQKFSIITDKKIIGIWIGARHNKKWDIKNFKTLYSLIISESNYSPILAFGIEEENDFSNIDKNKFNSILITDLKKLKSFISSCDIFICGDTGPLHFSFALGIPAIGVFLQDNYSTYGYAEGEKNSIIKPADKNEMIENILKSIKKT